MWSSEEYSIHTLNNVVNVFFEKSHVNLCFNFIPLHRLDVAAVVGGVVASRLGAVVGEGAWFGPKTRHVVQ